MDTSGDSTRIARRVEQVPPSGIRRFFELADEMDDVVSLGVGEPDFSPPAVAREAAIDSLRRGRTAYTASDGLPALRRAISEYATRYGHGYDPETEILVTTGVSEALDVTLRTLVDPGDAVAVVQPSYVSYVPKVRFAGGEPIPVPTREVDDFAPTYEDLERSGAGRAEVLLFCAPNNPTGSVIERDGLGEIADFARDHDLTVVSDEVYAALSYETEHTSIATLPGMRGRTVVCNGFSKAFAMTGLRLGYLLAPPSFVEAARRIHRHVMRAAPTPSQYAACAALREGEAAVAEMRDVYDARRRFVLDRLEALGLDCYEGTGAFYLFPECPGDDEAFAESLLQSQGVAVVPGSVFGEGGSGHVRLSYATSESTLREAFDRMETFLADRAVGPAAE